ncbi:rRNA maturation RNase YbeY [Clostridium sp. CM028]|uniref:rRNA maturation RNase YbeY n=1 Tax=unclassified Clostridium TaxID=2614128 RepID=UPI001C0A95B4|nr:MULTISPECIES: rRNA maturation RNase YbeY [unclassified Clostridium]MBU3090725.1 rRNA maturation RNase YbeY [Clostridium sp. CF011]MBW9144281.1 rRNA maturation RNase YbeY [Clostridium sp. CM027]MBW9147409.1 rRNA maturation RNase YbeY [Clostridium sp. CM028]UVE41084.1 rRNA maturation RNase YbeY [Clostridium sp. CM027]WAG70076.1 rRNA maturation RNase YbeY [Clostridium sp. CF011]
MIFIDNRQNKIEVSSELETVIKNVIEYTLKEEKLFIDNEVSVIFIDNEEIRKINLEHRGIDKITDVLSFPMLHYPENKVFKDVYVNYEFDQSDLYDERLVIGDVALSLEKAKQQSEEFRHSFTRECAYLTVHSILHLLGYDHMEEDPKDIMRKREEEILNNFKISR